MDGAILRYICKDRKSRLTNFLVWVIYGRKKEKNKLRFEGGIMAMLRIVKLGSLSLTPRISKD